MMLGSILVFLEYLNRLGSVNSMIDFIFEEIHAFSLLTKLGKASSWLHAAYALSSPACQHSTRAKYLPVQGLLCTALPLFSILPSEMMADGYCTYLLQ